VITLRVVDKYPQSAENHPIDRFKRSVQTMPVEIYIRELLNVVFQCRDQGKPLAVIFDELEAYIKAIETLRVTLEQHAVILCRLIESSLPVELIKVWQRSQHFRYNEDLSSTKPDKRLRALLDFLRQDVKGEERLSYLTQGILTGRDSIGRKKPPVKDKIRSQEDDIPTVAGLYIGEK
jgi:hypothetical protein